MQSPIFSTDTCFPVVTANGRVLRAGGEEPTLADGVTVQKLTKPIDLIEIETRAGNLLRLSAESVFSLMKADGKVMLFNPPDFSFRDTPRPGWGEAPQEDDWRLWFLIGAMLSGGNFAGDYNRPAKLIVNSDRAAVMDGIQQFLTVFAGLAKYRDKLGQSYAVKRRQVGERIILSSRVIDKIIKPFLGPKSHGPYFDPLGLNKQRFHGFISGVLFGMRRLTDRAVFIHRRSDVVKMLYRCFNERAGIPVQLKVSMMEPDVQYGRNVSDPHALFIFQTGLALCHDLGFVVGGSPREIAYTGMGKEEVVRVEPIGKQRACIVVAEAAKPQPSTANWFLFNPLFEIDPLITDFAAQVLAQDPAAHPAQATIPGGNI